MIKLTLKPKNKLMEGICPSCKQKTAFIVPIADPTLEGDVSCIRCGASLHWEDVEDGEEKQ
jgi:hypothetical protein